MRAVNLLPPPERRARGFSGGPRAPLAVAGAVLALGGLGYWGWSVTSEVDRVREDVAAATIERDDLQARIGAFEQAQARDLAQRTRRGAIVSLVQNRVNWERLVRDLSSAMPRQVWLVNLKGEADPAAADPAAVAAAPGTPVAVVPRGVHLDGYAFTQPQVALAMARAATVRGLGEPRLASSEVELKGGREVIHFVIDIPIDQRAQDRDVLAPTGSAPGAATGATP
ncbi:PilN domain-containing protein [Miltoncostaea marina]|uniref:PilN domain-containing protein n=1 Tax=Miltoncostaea marina TaxID=2843215 RepID=UPI001C3D0726|nr:hypothetical protein [Miltoncostaea marina]